jgi:hypothetical protein
MKRVLAARVRSPAAPDTPGPPAVAPAAITGVTRQVATTSPASAGRNVFLLIVLPFLGGTRSAASR